jgi:4-aminobutyrate aminotransferase-like enzyme
MSREQPESGGEARRVLDADARYFLHQAASTPGLSAVRRAEGIWVEDLDGRQFMDFQGNSVHHLGYAHRTLVAALKTQLDDLTFSPRRFTNDVAVALARRLAELAPEPLARSCSPRPATTRRRSRSGSRAWRPAASRRSRSSRFSTPVSMRSKQPGRAEAGGERRRS